MQRACSVSYNSIKIWARSCKVVGGWPSYEVQNPLTTGLLSQCDLVVSGLGEFGVMCIWCIQSFLCATALCCTRKRQHGVSDWIVLRVVRGFCVHERTSTPPPPFV